MNTLYSKICSNSSTILLNSARSILGNSSFYGIPSILPLKPILANYPFSIKSSNLGSFGVIQCSQYSTKQGSTRKRKSTRKSQTCVLEFDGASKRNPGPAGAGAVLRTLDGNAICRIRQGLGIATNNVAEYRGLILGLKRAVDMGYTSIRVQGDSLLVCMQLKGLWKVNNQNLAVLHAEATKLKKKFTSFKISHVLRDLNSDANTQANLGVSLANGEVSENLD